MRITKDNISNRSTEPVTPETSEEILTVLVVSNKTVQAVIPKSMVPDPEWFDRNRTKFKDWWRRICLFLKSNKVIMTDNKITTVLA